jgi:NADH-quinone oxidoreductase subunit C
MTNNEEKLESKNSSENKLTDEQKEDKEKNHTEPTAKEESTSKSEQEAKVDETSEAKMEQEAKVNETSETKIEQLTTSDQPAKSKENEKTAESSTTSNVEKMDKPKRTPRPRRERAKEEPKEEAPSPKQPQLEHLVKIITENLGKEALVEATINRSSKDLPTLIATREHYFQVAKLLREHEELQFNYLGELHGTDYETYMEVYVFLHSMEYNRQVALKVKLDRENPTIDSLVPIWEGANWPECEAYDLLGIQFTGHPDLKRILLGEDWVGHPLRKDYEPYDVEV